MPRKLSASTCLFAGGVLLLTSSLRAQTTNATLVGGVTDPQSSAVVGATVVVKNMATGISREVKTSDLGTYRVFPLNPGTYEITASAPGFKSKAAPNRFRAKIPRPRRGEELIPRRAIVGRRGSLNSNASPPRSSGPGD